MDGDRRTWENECSRTAQPSHLCHTPEMGCQCWLPSLYLIFIVPTIHIYTYVTYFYYITCIYYQNYWVSCVLLLSCGVGLDVLKHSLCRLEGVCRKGPFWVLFWDHFTIIRVLKANSLWQWKRSWICSGHMVATECSNVAKSDLGTEF